MTHICCETGRSGCTNWVKAAKYPAMDFGLIVAIATARRYNEFLLGGCDLIGSVAMIQPRRPRNTKNAAPNHLTIKIVVSDVAISAVSPAADRPKNQLACVKMPATQTSDVLNPYVIATLIQLTAFGPGVVTNTAQKLANMIHADRVINTPAAQFPKWRLLDRYKGWPMNILRRECGN